MRVILRIAAIVVASIVLAADGVTAQSATRASLLITPAELARELKDPRLVVLHVGPRGDYNSAHIPGSRFVTMADLSARRRGGALTLELPDDSTLLDRLEQLGIGDDSRIVVAFGEDWVSPATRVLFALQAAGLGGRTQFLDGGTAAWKRAELPVTREVPKPKPGRLTMTVGRRLIVDHRWIQANANTPGVRVIDARAPMFYEGPGMDGHSAGHIAGAVNVPFNSITNDSLQILPLDELRGRFQSAGIAQGDTVAVYCHVGQQATVVVLAARLLGHPVMLYDGSMDDWEKRKLPLVNGRKSPDGGADGDE